MEDELTDAQVDELLNESVPFDAERDRRVAGLFRDKWIAATAQANRETPQCNHTTDVNCSRCCDCDECKEIRLSDASAAFDVEFPNWMVSSDPTKTDGLS